MKLNSFAKIKSKSFRPLFSLLVKVIVTVWMRWLVIIHWKIIREFQLNYFSKSLLYVVSIEFSTKRNRPTDLKSYFLLVDFSRLKFLQDLLKTVWNCLKEKRLKRISTPQVHCYSDKINWTTQVLNTKVPWGIANICN
jgi:hypothetical protein